MAGLVAVCACTTDSSGPGTQGGAITLTVSVSALNIVRPGNGTVPATVGRTGDFTGEVTITIEGVPANVLATASPATIGSGVTSSTITITVANDAAAATTNLTIRARGTGVADRTATVALTVVSPATPGFAMNLSTGTLSIVQGAQNAGTTITMTRTGGFTGSVAFTQTGAPAGVTVTFNPANTTGNTSTITIAVGAAVAANTYQITIRANATGQTERTAVIALTVTASGGGGGNATFRACGQTMLYGAYQDGTGAWTPATITNGNTITGTIASGRGGLAYVTALQGGFSVVIRYGTFAELNTGAVTCVTAPATKTLLGSVANVTNPLERADVAMGPGGFTSVAPLVSTNFTLNNVVNIATDLIAGRILQTIGGTGIVGALNKGIIRRGINPAAGSTLPVLDFNAAESFTPVTRTLTIGNVGADAVSVQISFLTSATTQAQTALGIYSEVGGTMTPTRQHPTVPNAQAGDLHGYSIFTTPVGGASRAMGAYFRDGLDRTLNLGPFQSAVNVTTVSTAPARLRAQSLLQNEYNMGVVANYSQNAGGTFRTYNVNMSAGYIGAGPNIDVVMPDLTALAGWLVAWNFVAGTQIQWAFTVTGGNLTQLDGGIALIASRNGVITP
jgi:hypothetical protein